MSGAPPLARRLSRSLARFARATTPRVASASDHAAASIARNIAPTRPRGVHARAARAANVAPTRGFSADATSEDRPATPDAPQPSRASESETDPRDGVDRAERSREDSDEAHALTARLLTAALARVPELGWTDAALRAAAEDLGYSAAVAGQIPRGVGALVDHFADDCDSRLSVKIVLEGDDVLGPMTPRERIATVVKWRLEMLEPMIESWAAATAISAAPENAAATASRRAQLADEMCAAAGSGFGVSHVSRTAGWVADRAALMALYAACELYMLTDQSPGFEDTKAFVDARAKDLVELGKTAEELGGFAAAAARGLPGGGKIPMPPGGKEALEGLFSKVLGAAMGVAAGRDAGR